MTERGHARGTFACPICGQTTPHTHSAEATAAWRKEQARGKPAPPEPAGDAVTESAKIAARAWIEGYGIRTEPYTRNGGDHPMMDTLPDAFLSFARALAAPTSERSGWRDGMLRAAKIADGFTCGCCGMDCKCSEAIRVEANAEPPAATPGEAEGEPSFQARVDPWLLACFGEEIARDREERNHRFLEESLELVQSCDCTRSEAHQLVDYVFDRPAGEPKQESGGVSVTHAALCLANGIDMHEAAEAELTRIWTKVEKIRAKQAAKPKHSPLPGAAKPPSAPDRAPLTSDECLSMIAAERVRQKSAEGWTEEHDDTHDDSSLMRAAMIYLWHGTERAAPLQDDVPLSWPWGAKWWKPKDRMANLRRAGGLMLAEKERLVRCGAYVGHVDQKLCVVIREMMVLSSSPCIPSAPEPGRAIEIGYAALVEKRLESIALYEKAIEQNQKFPPTKLCEELQNLGDDVLRQYRAALRADQGRS